MSDEQKAEWRAVESETESQHQHKPAIFRDIYHNGKLVASQVHFEAADAIVEEANK